MLWPGGMMRVSCPDFEMLARNYVEAPSSYFESMNARGAFPRACASKGTLTNLKGST